MEKTEIHWKLISAAAARLIAETPLDRVIEGISKHIEMAAKEGNKSIVCNISELHCDAVIAILSDSGYTCVERHDIWRMTNGTSERYITISW